MIKVITYGTYDLLHFGHIRLLERAKELGDYLVVGVTSDDFDKSRGKINVQQSLMERIDAVRKTGIADEIIVEEYAGQKIDDIRNMGIDIFTVGSDWEGKFDYLNEFCKVVYLDRTQGVSSSELRSRNSAVRLGMYGNAGLSEFDKYKRESMYVNGAELVGICRETDFSGKNDFSEAVDVIEYDNFDELLENSDAVFIETNPRTRYAQIKKALEQKKHVLCKAPITLKKKEATELLELARQQGVVLMGAIKTAYSTAYKRLLLLAKSGHIGRVVHVDVTCTRIEGKGGSTSNKPNDWNSICTWGPFGLLPVFHLLGTDYNSMSMTTCPFEDRDMFDAFTKIDFVYKDSTASVKVGKGVKSEGELVIAGTKGYIFVPAPWWKTDFFEIRYEKLDKKKRFFYELNGEGIRFEIASFIRSIQNKRYGNEISDEILESISGVVENYYDKKNINILDPIKKDYDQ